SARDVLVRMLDVCVDAAVKDRLTSAEPDGSGGELDDVHKQWLTALTRPDGTIDADPDALEDLRQQLDEWTRSLETTGEQGSDSACDSGHPNPNLNPIPTPRTHRSVPAMSALSVLMAGNWNCYYRRLTIRAF